jgi:hypothetical protein
VTESGVRLYPCKVCARFLVLKRSTTCDECLRRAKILRDRQRYVRKTTGRRGRPLIPLPGIPPEARP